MQIVFDANKMHVQVVAGILEKVEPSENTQKIYSKVEDLKKELEKFRSEIVSPKIKEIQLLIEEENKKYISKANEEAETN